jgi:hypothetical protein
LSVGSINVSVDLNMNNNNITNINKLSGDVRNNIITTTHRIYQNISKRPIYEISSSSIYEINTTYELNTSSLTWLQHRDNALRSGKTLAVILNPEQNEIVKNLAAGYNVYIGGLRTSNSSARGKTSADWQWMTGDTWSYNNFDSLAPFLINEKYLEMYPNGTWNDTLGTSQARAIYMSTFYEDERVNGYYGLAKDAYPSLNPYSNGALAISSWNGRSYGVDSNFWRSVCWSPELGIFVAVGSGGTTNTRVMISYNGISWTPISQGVEFNSWSSVCWSPQLRIFVAVASSGTTNNRVMTSSTGTTWTSIIGGVELNSWSSVCWSPQLGLFVAVASGGTTNNRLMTSRYGTGWTTISLGVEVNEWKAVCWSPELMLFVAVGQTGNNRVMTSPSGRTWTPISQGVDANAWQSVCWSPQLGIFVAVAASGTTNNRVMTSANGRSWTGISQGVDISGSWTSVCWSPQLGLFVAVASSGNNRVMTSANGTIWTATSQGVDNAWQSICWSPEQGIFVAVSNSGTSNRVMTSSLKGRPPTSYNVFDSNFNSIDESGNWTFSKIISPSANIIDLSVNTINGQECRNLIYKINMLRQYYGITG